LDLKAAGLHTTPKGKEIIHKIHSQMNNNRLSTNSPDVNIDTVQLHNEVKNLLTQSTNHLNKGKSVDLVNERGELVMSFPSVYSCAKYLGINKYKVNQSLKLNKSIDLDNKVYYVRNR